MPSRRAHEARGEGREEGLRRAGRTRSVVRLRPHQRLQPVEAHGRCGRGRRRQAWAFLAQRSVSAGLRGSRRRFGLVRSRLSRPVERENGAAGHRGSSLQEEGDRARRRSGCATRRRRSVSAPIARAASGCRSSASLRSASARATSDECFERAAPRSCSRRSPTARMGAGTSRSTWRPPSFTPLAAIRTRARARPSASTEASARSRSWPMPRASEVARIESPRPLRRGLRALEKKSKALSRAKLDSRNRHRARARVAKAHARIAYVRRDFAHRESSRLAKTHGRLVIEDLCTIGLMRTSLARAIADSGWSLFASMLALQGSLVRGHAHRGRSFLSEHAKVQRVRARRRQARPVRTNVSLQRLRARGGP